MPYPRVILIILNFNGGDLVLRCVESAMKVDYPNFVAILVDNGSTDGSAAVIHKRFPEVVIVRSPENVGVSEGRNVGIRRAFLEEFDYLLFCDHDVVFLRDTLARFVSVTERYSKIGIAGALFLSSERPEGVQVAGMRIDFREVVVKGIPRLRDDDFSGRFIVVDGVGAGHMLVKREVLEAIGMFDPGMFWGMEEADFCVRARSAGFCTVVVPSARALHRGGTTLGGPYSPSRNYLYMISCVRFMRKHGRRQDWAKFLVFFFTGLFAAFCRELCLGRRKSVGAKLMGFRDEILRKNIGSEFGNRP